MTIRRPCRGGTHIALPYSVYCRCAKRISHSSLAAAALYVPFHYQHCKMIRPRTAVPYGNALGDAQPYY